MKPLANTVKVLWITITLVMMAYCGARITDGGSGDSGISGSGGPSASASGATTDYGGSPGAIYSFVGWDANSTAGTYPDKMTIRCTSVLDPAIGATVAGTYTGSTSVSAVSFGANGEGLGGISVLNTGTQNSLCKYDSASGTANLANGNSVSGTGIPGGATIASVDSSTQITLSANATATTASLAITANGTTKFGDITTGSAVVTNLVSAGTISGIDVDPLDTTGKTGIKVFYEAGQISDQTREYGIQLQYDCGSGYTAVGTDFRSSDSQVGSSTTYSQMGPYSLPVACEGNTAVKLRWRYYFVSGAAGSRTRIAIKNIRVSSDATNTTFTGLSTATASNTTTVNLTWPAGTDDVTTASYMRYDIYQAAASAGYGTAAYGTQPAVAYTIRGTTNATITGLTPSTTYYFVVRARDEQGNRNASGAISVGTETEKTVTTPADLTPPTVATIFPSSGINVSTTNTSVPVTFNVTMDPTTLTLASTNFQVKSGSDCTGAALTGASIIASNGNKTFTLTLNGGQLVAGNSYTTCLTSNVKSAGGVALSAYSATWTAVSGTNLFEGFESWATANQPTNWTFVGAAPFVSTGITQDSTTPHGGTLAVKLTGTMSGSNGNILNTSGTVNPGSCTRLAVWMRGTTTGKSLSLQLQSQGSTNANYCNVNNTNIASSIASATAIAPASAGYTGTDINTSGNWMVAVCQITGMTGGTMDVFNFRGGSSGVYAISFDDISFLDDNNNPCIPIDTTPPTVSSTTPANAATSIAYGSTIAVTFSEAMNTSTVTGQTSTSCAGSIQVSSDNFSTCVQMTSATPAFASNTATLTPAAALVPNTTYLIRVTTAVKDSAGNFLASQFTTATGFTTAALADPTALAFTPANTQITVGWTNSSNANAGVKIVRATGSAPADCTGAAICQGATCNATLTAGSTGRTYVDSGLTNGTQYFYRVCANHTGPATLSAGVTGSSTPSNVDVTPPANPGSPTYTAGNTQNTLGWSNPADSDFAGIKIVFATGATPPTDCSSGTTVCTGTGCNANVTASATGLTYIHTGLTNGTQYSYRMCSYDAIPNMSTGVTGSATPALGNYVTLASSPYTETFDSIGTALPTGWTVYTVATASSLGTISTLTTAQTAWSATGAAFGNCASANGLTSSSNATAQNSSTDRALSVRQTGAFGDPGAAFVVQLANTSGRTNFNLSFKLQELDPAVGPGRTTTWLVQYGFGASPSSFTSLTTSPATLTTVLTNGWANTSVTAGFGSAIDNQSGVVTIRVVTLGATTGGGSRPRTAVDDFTLTWN